MIEIVTRQLDSAELLEEAANIICCLPQGSDQKIRVRYGVGANLLLDEMWKPTTILASQLTQFVDMSIDKGIFVPGKTDLFIEDLTGTVTFRLCHEADIHLETNDNHVLKCTEDRWRSKAYQGFRREDSGEWKELAK